MKSKVTTQTNEAQIYVDPDKIRYGLHRAVNISDTIVPNNLECRLMKNFEGFKYGAISDPLRQVQTNEAYFYHPLIDSILGGDYPTFEKAKEGLPDRFTSKNNPCTLR